MKRMILCMMLLAAISVSAQQYSGMTGLIHVPSAEMDAEGDARIGAHFLNREFTPKNIAINGCKYNTFDVYLSITPFWWIEASFVMTFEKGQSINGEYVHPHRFLQKDRQFGIKLAPVREGKYIPAIAVGVQDIFSDKSMGISYFNNYYVAVTKHVNVKGQEIGVDIAYRHFDATFNHKWNGLVGGVTYRPSFARNLRAIVEWTGCDVNFGIDCLLWRHILLQASIQDGKYPSAGICYKVNLF